MKNWGVNLLARMEELQLSVDRHARASRVQVRQRRTVPLRAMGEARVMHVEGTVLCPSRYLTTPTRNPYPCQGANEYAR
jgi:hypothetical protein